MENIDKTSNFLFYNTEDGKNSVQVIADQEEETIWTTQKGMSEIFDVEENTITYHLGNIYDSQELARNSTTRKFRVVRKEGNRDVSREIDFYNLDVIISVGYRVNSQKATSFRKWSTKTLREYLIKGFVLDDERLKQGNQLFNKDYFQDLIERIREIRASERMFWEKITDLYRDCSLDYDKESSITINFYKSIQNKFHYAICQHTAAEIIKYRADSNKPYMGLTNWKNEKKGGKILKSDVSVAKNYLSEGEIKGLNRLVTMFLDYAENLAEKGTVSYMEDWAKRLDSFLKFNEYPLLEKFGKVSSDVAKRFAETEFEKFRIIQDREYKSDFNKLIEASTGNIPIETFDKIEKENLTDFNQSLKKGLMFNPKKGSDSKEKPSK